MGLIPGVLSRLKYAGLRNGTSAPYFFATVAIFLFSVLTISRSISLVFFASRIVQAIKGNPANRLIFFPGIPLDPPLAGITARTLLRFFKSGSFFRLRQGLRFPVFFLTLPEPALLF